MYNAQSLHHNIFPAWYITVMSHERHRVSDHWPIDCSFSISFWLTSKKHQRSTLLTLCEGNSPVAGGPPSHSVSNAESLSVSWRQYARQPHIKHGIEVTKAAFINFPLGTLLTWINFNPGMNKHPNYIHYYMWDGITYPFPNSNGVAVEVWGWISSFNPNFTGHVRTYAYRKQRFGNTEKMEKI